MALRILREVERIPALRRLSDSALRVTSASDADGRLAALALYRLGSAARAAENAMYAPAVASPSASVSDSLFASGTTTPGLPPVAAGAAAHGGEHTADGGRIPTDDGNKGRGANGEKGTEGVVEQTAEESGGDDKDAGHHGRLAVPHIISAEKKSTLPGDGRGDRDSTGFPIATAVLMPADEATVANATHISETEDTGIEDGGIVINGEAGVMNEGKNEGHVGDGALAAEAAVASAAAASAAFDVGGITSDLRFEQLVEIVECTASRMTVSDVSKVRDRGRAFPRR